MKDSGSLDEAGNPELVKKYKAVYGRTVKEVEEKAYELKIKIGKGMDVSSAQDIFKKWADILLADKKWKNSAHLT